jgi:hypothetical protein
MYKNLKVNKDDIKRASTAYDVQESPLQGAPSDDIVENDRINTKGLYSTSCKYYGLLNPICKYAFTKMILEDEEPLFITGGGYEKGPATTEIQTDVNDTMTVYDSISAVYSDRIVTASDNYGDFSVVCYAKKKADTKKYVKALKSRMASDNQYRGKCLFYGGDGVIFRDEMSTVWDDVIIAEKSKKEIVLNTLSFLTNPDLRKLGLNQRGVILHGPPGTGKTMVVKSLFSSLKGKDVTRIYATADTFTSASDMTSLFDFLKYAGATALAFEDMDLISPDRSEGGVGRKILGSLLNNLDGIRKVKDPFVIVGTTNDIHMMDRALANRPCRFDRKIEVPLPSPDEVSKFYKVMANADVNEDIVKMSSGFAGAHIKEVINTARLLSVEHKKPVEECMKLACEIIRDNFFPMTKEATTAMYKNNKGGLTKEAQQMIMLMPFSDGYDSMSNIFPFLNSMTDPNKVNNKEATALWNTWKNQDGEIKDNKIKTQGMSEEVLNSLQKKEIIENVGHDEFSLTEKKGKKFMRELILTQEVSPFDINKKEDEEIDVQKIKGKIMGGNNKKIKSAGKESDERKPIDSTVDWYYESIKNLPL